jgi:hypothetical protein
VREKHRIEDAWVEVKGAFPSDTRSIARQLAGHANTARGEPILWVFGLDERRGVVGVSYAELANWWPQVAAHFDGEAPAFADANVRAEGRALVALVFDTTAAPFVVRTTTSEGAGEGKDRDVPWREGTRTRSARRHEMLGLLVPWIRVPEYEVIDVYADSRPSARQEEASLSLDWSIDLWLYLAPISPEPVVLPFHHTRMWVRSADDGEAWAAPRVFISIPNPQGAAFRTPATATVTVSATEAVLTGPAMVIVSSHFTTVAEGFPADRPLRVGFTLSPFAAARTVTEEVEVLPRKPTGVEHRTWQIKEQEKESEGRWVVSPRAKRIAPPLAL